MGSGRETPNTNILRCFCVRHPRYAGRKGRNYLLRLIWPKASRCLPQVLFVLDKGQSFAESSQALNRQRAGRTPTHGLVEILGGLRVHESGYRSTSTEFWGGARHSERGTGNNALLPISSNLSIVGWSLKPVRRSSDSSSSITSIHKNPMRISADVNTSWEQLKVSHQDALL